MARTRRPHRASVTLLLTLLALATPACGDDSTATSADGSDPASSETSDTTTASADGTTTSADGTTASADGTTTSADGTTASADGASTDDGAPAEGATAELSITVSHPADPEPVTYTISCGVDGTASLEPAVDELDGAAACAQLAAPGVADRLVAGPPADQVCTEIYGGPDEATVVGQLDGAAVNTVITRENGCAIDDWDRLLSAVLPPALGVVE